MTPTKTITQRLIDYLTRNLSDEDKPQMMQCLSHITPDDDVLDYGDTYDMQAPPRMRAVDREVLRGLEGFISLGYLQDDNYD